MNGHRVAVIVPVWNGAEVLRPCVQSARALSPQELIVVDNASTDRSIEVAESTAPEARIRRATKNLGFASACNTGARWTSAPFLLILNQDAIADAGGIRELLEFAHSHPQCAAIGGRIENSDGTLQPSMGPRPHPLRVALDRIPGLRRVIPSHLYRNPRAYSSAREPAWLTGACLLLRRAALNDVGLFDEGYFMYTEDLDWCTRARKRGWKLQYLPVRTAVHADEGRRPDRARAKAAWMREGLLQFFETHGTRRQARMFRGMLWVEERLKNIKIQSPNVK